MRKRNDFPYSNVCIIDAQENTLWINNFRLKVHTRGMSHISFLINILYPDKTLGCVLQANNDMSCELLTAEACHSIIYTPSDVLLLKYAVLFKLML